MKRKVKSKAAAKMVKAIVSPFNNFLKIEAAGGITLMLATLVAMVWANSPFHESYEHFIHYPIKFGIGSWVIEKGLAHWVNDGLMTIFFYVVGLEIKRELFIGELSSPRKAALPLFAALGGMIAPALIYVSLNLSGEGLNGWGIPMATDIAFAVGILSLFSNRVPFALKVFLLALAIVDDLGAVLVIAFFYTSQIFQTPLAIAMLTLFGILILRMAGLRSKPLFMILSVVVWFAILKSGIHATIAGVLLGFLVPLDSGYDKQQLFERVKELLKSINVKDGKLTHDEELTVKKVAFYTKESLSPLEASIHGLHNWVSYIIMPLFALVNAGVYLGDVSLAEIFNHQVSLGIILGLVLGKPIGVVFFSWLSIKLNLASLPEGVGWMQITCVGFLAGIGFTMAIFVANLALPPGELISFSKLGILVASLTASVVGAIMLLASKPIKKS